MGIKVKIDLTKFPRYFIDEAAMLLSLSAIDVTEAAVAKVDAALGTGIPAVEPLPEAAEWDGKTDKLQFLQK